MTKGDWLDLTVLERRKYNCLSEVMDLSQQMGEALDRNDQVSVRMLLALRQDPILALEEVKRAINAKRAALTSEERERVSVLDGGDGPENTEEAAYAAQAGSARRLLERVVELDRRLSLRLGGKSSYYAEE